MSMAAIEPVHRAVSWEAVIGGSYLNFLAKITYFPCYLGLLRLPCEGRLAGPEDFTKM